uniref:Ionotropic glutamate receptor L-glutamate and glycine-binding domain-containing protein n=1 Tax=Plectus sambesii TaxID=2011161 RepID=A0A914XJ75_9BILA
MVTPLRIAVQTDWKREASECSLGGFERRESCKLPGYAVEILDFVTKYIKMPYIIVPVSKGVGADMIWDGVLGGIQNGRYDTAASPYMLNSDRYATFDFATPFTSTQLMFVIGPSPPDFFAGSVRLFTVFEPTLTTLIIGTLLALICGVFINQAFVTERESLQIRENAPEIVKDDHCMLGEKLRQHKESTQRSATGRTLLLLLNFTLLFFTGLYESCLLTFLLVPTSDVHLTEAQILDLVYEKKLTFVISEDEYYK